MTYFQNRLSLTLLFTWLLIALTPTVVAQPQANMKLAPLAPIPIEESASPRRPSQNKGQRVIRRRSFQIYRMQRIIAVLAAMFHGGAWILLLCRDRLIRRYLSDSKVVAVEFGTQHLEDRSGQPECALALEPPAPQLFDSPPQPLTPGTVRA